MSNRNGDQLYTGHKLLRDIGGTTTTISSGKNASDDTSFMTSHLRYINSPAAAQLLGNSVFNILDTPNTTSAISYLLQHAQLGSNNWTQTGGAYFTLMEIAG
jgi:hypothetical protein